MNRFDLWLLVRRTAPLTTERRLVSQPDRDAEGRVVGARDAETGDWITVDPGSFRALEALPEGVAARAAFSLGCAA